LVFTTVERAKGRFPDLLVREWNLAEHPELGPRYGVLATPAVVIDGRLEFRGIPNERVLLERLEAVRKGAGR
jgi:hypothetical protein